MTDFCFSPHEIGRVRIALRRNVEVSDCRMVTGSEPFVEVHLHTKPILEMSASNLWGRRLSSYLDIDFSGGL